MEKYSFPAERQAFLEEMNIPFAIYQYVDKRIVTLVLSAGFCKQFGFEDRAKAYDDLNHDIYSLIHPDDVSRVADSAVRFAAEEGDFDLIYRTRIQGSSDYRILHAKGEHIFPEEGVRLGQVWFTDEGPYTGNGKAATKLNRELRSALQEGSLLKNRSHDYLTGLPSISYFFELAEAGKEAALHRGAKPVLLYMDFVGMKGYNHNFSFAKGDELLLAFARLLSATFGSENCSRLGQDQFAVFAEEQGVEKTLEKLFRDCKSLNGGDSLPLRVGIFREWTEDIHISKACDQAKIACDTLRKSGVSCFCYYNEELRHDVTRRQMILAGLDKALAEKHIQVYYQPIIRTANGMICDEEALARWIDPQEGLLSPGEFIPYLEDSGQIYRLDLYVLEQVLEKMVSAAELGHRVVPHSINLSRSDFDACDIVEEIRERVDNAGVSRELICVELTESTVGNDFELMKEQIERFRELGFPVWLDDFGSGYSSLDALQSIEFDLVKFDMNFMRKLDDGEGGKIVLTELMKLATSLGSDTVCEGVENVEQVHFLQEIGCAKMQGYYYEKPLSLKEIQARRDHPRYGYENQDEVAYYEAIGRVNLYDLAMIGSEEENTLRGFFNTLPMGIIEIRGSTTRFIRSNQSYRDFLKRFLGFDLAVEGSEFAPYDDAFMNNVVKTCVEQGIRSFFDEQMPNGSVIHSFARRVGTNPVTGTVAVLLAVLSITDPNEGTTYASIARALAADYYNIYCVDLDTEHFIEYSTASGKEMLAMERHGNQFFASVKWEAIKRVYAEDRGPFLEAFTKENVLRELKAHGVYSLTYRLVDTGKPLYVNMKITWMNQSGNQIILGISFVDDQIQQQRQLENARKEREALAQAMALSEDFLSLYWVDPESGRYVQYSSVGAYDSFDLAREGEDFFRQGVENIKPIIRPEDLDEFERGFTRENILRDIREKGSFQVNYTLLFREGPQPVSLRIARVRDGDEEKLIAGVRLLHKDAALPASAPEAVSAPETEARKGNAQDFQTLVDQLEKPCAVISVEKNPDGSPGDVRIVCGNREYKQAMGSGFRDGMLYYELVPKVLQFEYSCFRCAFQHQQIHTYIQTKVNDAWTDQQLIPLHSDRENIGYCQFILEISETRDRELMSAVSVHTAAAVLRAAITLLGTNELQERVDLVLRDIMYESGAFNVRIVLVDHENKEAINYSNQMVVEMPEDFIPPEEDPDAAMISYPLLCSWEDTIGHSNSLVVANETQMDELALRNPKWVRTMRAYSVTTLMLIPLRHEQEIIGYLYLCNFDPEKVNEVRELAELMSFFLGTEIYNEVLLKRLDAMSHTDALTGLNNRNAMIQRTNRMLQNETQLPFGLVNLDLNGLKTVNDTGGHDAGDKLLIHASEVLKKYFYQKDLYRTGGDEFVVIATDITREAFERKVERLRQATKKHGDVRFAIGSFWSDGSTDINRAFRIADESMYADKKAFYAEHPELRR